MPVAVEIWPVDLPRLDDAHAFRTAFNFNSNMSSWYPQGTEPATWWSDWFSFLAKHRLSGDSLYLDAPRPVEEYQHLAASGAPRMNVRGDWAATWDPAAIEQLRPTVTALKELGLGDRLYSYGFDEWPQLQNASVYSVFGALKKEWPWLKTMATLNWDDMPADLPLDVWVDGYGGDYGSSDSYLLPTPKEKLRQAWLSSREGREYWWYWACCDPPDVLNTHVESPAIQTRLMYWLAALHGVSGMLYFDVAIWSNQCPAARPCKPLQRINGSGLVTFMPATWNGQAPATAGGGANGKGGASLFCARFCCLANHARVAVTRGRELHIPRARRQTAQLTEAGKRRRWHRRLGAVCAARSQRTQRLQQRGLAYPADLQLHLEARGSTLARESAPAGRPSHHRPEGGQRPE